MSEKALRTIFIFGTLFFFVVLGVLSVDSLTQVLTTRTPALTSDVTAGKGLWENRNCNDCHTILGIGGYFAPELTKVAIRRDPTWISNFLLDPLATKPGTTMPNQKLTAIQANQLVSFFQWVALVDTNGWPPQPKLALGGASAGAAEIMDPVQNGELLFTLKGCNACHMVNGLGAIGPGPDLSLIGSTP